ncbi:MAG TPA: serine/threonine protein phosphatase [Polyangia bacterium]|nr:serine/threonine protein phosphatase [Polyangia bacterium]
MDVWRTAELSIGQSARNEDRVAVLAAADRVVLVVADGAGGSGRGADAAESIVALVRKRSATGPFDAAALLREADAALAPTGGESTAVIVTVDDRGISGASVGDSAAWIVDGAGYVDLTERQRRKPLVGSGRAQPSPFHAPPLTGTLLLGTDGLFKYAPPSLIRQIATDFAFATIADRLIASVRLPSGVLHDDTTIAICRRA